MCTCGGEDDLDIYMHRSATHGKICPRASLCPDRCTCEKDRPIPPEVVALVESPRAQLPAYIKPPPTSKTAAEAAAELVPGLPQWERRGHWGAVIESVEQVDPPALYRELVAALRLGEAATDYGTVHRALDNAEHNAFRAGQLARAAKLEQERVDRTCDQELEVLRTRARKELEQEKGGKKATLQEVDDRMMAAGTGWPDLVSRLKRRKDEAHAQRGTCEHLEESWRSRCNTLRVMATKLRPIEVAEGVG